jgi:hypothetical protein
MLAGMTASWPGRGWCKRWSETVIPAVAEQVAPRQAPTGQRARAMPAPGSPARHRPARRLVLAAPRRAGEITARTISGARKTIRSAPLMPAPRPGRPTPREPHAPSSLALHNSRTSGRATTTTSCPPAPARPRSRTPRATPLDRVAGHRPADLARHHSPSASAHQVRLARERIDDRYRLPCDLPWR